MITKKTVVEHLVGKNLQPIKEEAVAFAPANIALIKYWGKRNSELNLPLTNSLSIALNKGTHTKITVQKNHDSVYLNGIECSLNESFSKRLIAFIDLFRTPGTYFRIETVNEIPTAAGFASSSSGFAALTLALHTLYNWKVSPKELSALARLGSGSASRSIYQRGFVEWKKGSREDGLDSVSVPLKARWPELQIGYNIISDKQKPIDSRSAMQQTIETSTLYNAGWKKQVACDLKCIKEAIRTQNFTLLGETCERNALVMHATMLGASPPILYWQPETVLIMHKIWQLRKEGLRLYFTMDAGPNIKMLYLLEDQEAIETAGIKLYK